MLSYHLGEGHLLSSVHQFDANLFWEHSHRNTQNNVLPAMWAFLHPVKLTGALNHHGGHTGSGWALSPMTGVSERKERGVRIQRDRHTERKVMW